MAWLFCTRHVLSDITLTVTCCGIKLFNERVTYLYSNIIKLIYLLRLREEALHKFCHTDVLLNIRMRMMMMMGDLDP